MQTSALGLIELISDDLKFNGAPRRALEPLEVLETLCESRDPEYYNESDNYKQAVEVALNVKKEVLQGLTLEAMWEETESAESDLRAGVSEVSLTHRDPSVQHRVRTAKRQRACAALAAREGEHETAASLLRLSLANEALGEASAAFVERAIAAESGGGRSAEGADGGQIDTAQLLPLQAQGSRSSHDAGVERWRLDVVQLCVEEGCLAPWPPMLVHLLTSGSAATMRAGAALLVTQLRQDHSKGVGAEVLTYDLESEIWRAGRIIKVIDTQQEAKLDSRSKAKTKRKPRGGGATANSRARAAELHPSGQAAEGEPFSPATPPLLEAGASTESDGGRSPVGHGSAAPLPSGPLFDVQVGSLTLRSLPTARVFVPDSRAGLGALLREASALGSAPLVAELLRLGVSVFCVTRTGTTALHRAAEAGRVEVCRLLVEAGADPFLDNAQQASPYEESVRKRQSKVRCADAPPLLRSRPAPSPPFSGDLQPATNSGIPHNRVLSKNAQKRFA